MLKRAIETTKKAPSTIYIPKNCNPSYYPVIWIELPLKMGGRKCWVLVGVCGYMRQAFTITSNIVYLLTIKDLIVDNGKCEEARRCINLWCPLNKTSFESWVQGRVKATPKRIKNWKRNCKTLIEIVAKIGVDKIFDELQAE